MTDKLDFDLEFLDKKPTKPLKKENKKSAVIPPVPPPPAEIKTNFKPWIIVISIALISLWVVSVSQEKEKPTVQSSNKPQVHQDQIRVGDYSCSETHSFKSNQLLPEKSEKELIESEQQDLKGRSAEVEALAETLGRTQVNEYSQESVDNYNARIEQYNTKLNKYKEDAANLKNRIAQFNEKIDAYNTYLAENCRKTS